jgi:hypothetical protein
MTTSSPDDSQRIELTTEDRLHALEREVQRLSACIGCSPNAATGAEGAGLCRVVSELATASKLGHRKVIGGATVGAAGMVGLVEGVLALLRALG